MKGEIFLMNCRYRMISRRLFSLDEGLSAEPERRNLQGGRQAVAGQLGIG